MTEKNPVRTNTKNEYLNETLKTNKDYVVAIDTDSLYVCLNEFVKRFDPANPINFLDKLCSASINLIVFVLDLMTME